MIGLRGLAHFPAKAYEFKVLQLEIQHNNAFLSAPSTLVAHHVPSTPSSDVANSPHGRAHCARVNNSSADDHGLWQCPLLRSFIIAMTERRDHTSPVRPRPQITASVDLPPSPPSPCTHSATVVPSEPSPSGAFVAPVALLPEPRGVATAGTALSAGTFPDEPTGATASR